MIRYKNRLSVTKCSWGAFRDDVKRNVRNGFNTFKVKRLMALAKAYMMCCKDKSKLYYGELKLRLLGLRRKRNISMSTCIDCKKRLYGCPHEDKDMAWCFEKETVLRKE